MSFRLEPATIKDVPTLVTIFDEAFAQDGIVSHIFIDVPKEVRWERDLKWYSAAFEDSESNGARFTKVIDTSNGYHRLFLCAYFTYSFPKDFKSAINGPDHAVNREVAGFSKFDVPHILTAAQKAGRESGPRNRGSVPQGTNVPLYDDFFGQLDRGLGKWVDPEKDTYLHILAVRPKYHRLGVGSQLIRAGLEVADAARSKVYIVASPVGLPLYIRHGWKRLDQIVVDMTKYGGSSVVVEELLLRAVEPGC